MQSLTNRNRPELEYRSVAVLSIRICDVFAFCCRLVVDGVCVFGLFTLICRWLYCGVEQPAKKDAHAHAQDSHPHIVHAA